MIFIPARPFRSRIPKRTREAYRFVATLGASNYTFAETTLTR